jgi:F-type H+-transporting ATPase subunit b
MIGTAFAASGDAGHGPFYTTPEFWVLVAFVLFIVVAGRAIWRQVSGALDARATTIAGQLDEAQKLREQAQALLAEYQAKQREAANDAAAIVAQAREEAARLKQHAADGLANALKQRERQAVDRIAQAEAKALSDVRNMAVDLAIAASREVLREQVGTAQAAQAQMIEQSLAELPKRLN